MLGEMVGLGEMLVGGKGVEGVRGSTTSDFGDRNPIYLNSIFSDI